MNDDNFGGEPPVMPKEQSWGEINIKSNNRNSQILDDFADFNAFEHDRNVL